MSSSKRGRSLRNEKAKDNENSEVPDSVNMVMNLEELRDIIVTQVITCENDLNDNRDKDIQSLRLVSKEWLSSVSKLLYKNGIPLIQFNFDSNHTIKLMDKFVQEWGSALASGSWPRLFNLNQITPENIAAAKRNAKTLDKFVKNFRSDFSANNRNAPTYSLKLDSIFLEVRNFSTFQNCLVHCGKGLAQLKMELPRNCHLPKTLPKFALPTLKSIMFNTGFMAEYWSTSESETEEQQLEMACIENAGNLLKHLLEGSGSLEQLILINTVGPNLLGFDKYLLPTTLSKLFITVYSMKDVEIISNYVLPKLSDLNLTIKETPVLADIFFNMLSNWRKTLKVLFLEFDIINATESIQVRFPVMEKLATFEFGGQPCEITQIHNSLESCFPKLKSLDLSLTEYGFQMWCVNSVFHLVEKLTIKLDSPMEIALDGNLQLEHIAINLQNIQLTNMTFPNVTSLEITILGNETCVLQYIFKEMVRLTELRLNVPGTSTRTIRNSTFWDALLTGVTAETAEELKRTLDNPDGAEIIENISTPSIRRLTNLTDLLFSHKVDLEGAEPIISEVSFIHAFFKMPNLDTLSLRGRFMISDEMQESLRPKQPEMLLIHNLKP